MTKMRLSDAVTALSEVLADIAEGDEPIIDERLSTLMDAAQDVVNGWER